MLNLEKITKELYRIEEDIDDSTTLGAVIDKQYFLDKYGSLKQAKSAYKEIYGDRQYGRSWSDFIAVAITNY